ncbi:DUF6978 family protein [Listeria aquatica]|uniref:Putative prophage protein n=1 Tax=Listeria aquatica FSL S10-1188 TaxID=1265818 RepID=W7AZD4_9LIST|nr:hypothetical protein [Listeria aquatica]EUJ18972.1 putative prophage protein [Listeria aquatica FSL S10-1188]
MLTNEDIRNLIASFKQINDPFLQKIWLPDNGEKSSLKLQSNLTTFTVDLNRAGRKAPKCTFQLREDLHRDTKLIRLDLCGPAHENPNGDFEYANQIIACPHIHIADEKYGDSIAYPLNENYAKMYLTSEELEDIAVVFRKFLERIHVVKLDKFEIYVNTTILY